MKMNILKMFKVKPEERLVGLVALAVIVALNVLFILRLHGLFMQPGFGPYQAAFLKEFHLSGYDPITYLVVSDWDVLYEVFRHPLLTFMVWPLYIVNQGLTWLFGVNCVQYLVALPLICCSFYAFIFLYRIHHEVVGLSHWDATLLTAFHFSFAYILMSVFVPDHFTISMFLLLLLLYITGICIKKGREFKWWQSAILFYIIAGVTLTNGVKVFLSGIFVNLKDFFRPKYLLLAVVLPIILVSGTAYWQHLTFVVPREQAKTEQKLKKAEAIKARIAKMKPEERLAFKQKQEKREKRKQMRAAKSGQPMEDHGFLKWTDISTSRIKTTYENLFGESLQFHQDYFLEDVLINRPVFVPYRWNFSYVVEGLILLLFVAGVWFGRKSRFLWLCLSYLVFNMFIHIILGFGINEIYIMTPHWAYILPIATAFLFSKLHTIWLRVAVLLLTLYLFVYNGWLLTDFLLSPIKTVI